jgi:DNA-binding NtrC family response regulator
LVFRQGRFVPLAAGIASGRETSPLVAVACVLAAEDRSSDEVAGQLSSDADRDALHAAIRRFRRGQAEHYDPARLVGVSPAMQTVRRQIALAAAASVPVTIIGLPRTGRDHVARAIHYHPPADVACKLIPLDANSLSVEELKWAFRALERESRPGRPGTLLVREIDQASPDVQKELRAVVMSRQPGVRVLVTSTEDPRSLVERQVTGDNADEAVEPFDRSLAIALATLIICLPPLHERRGDLPLLAQLFVEECNRATGNQIGGLKRGAVELLATYSWPGGIDELRDVIQTAHAAAAGTEITSADLPPIIHHAAAAAEIPAPSTGPIDLEAYLVRIERELIERALRIADGNKTRAAELVGMTRPRFYRRLEQLEL